MGPATTVDRLLVNGELRATTQGRAFTSTHRIRRSPTLSDAGKGHLLAGEIGQLPSIRVQTTLTASELRGPVGLVCRLPLLPEVDICRRRGRPPTLGQRA